MKRLNCAACHRRDGNGAQLPIVLGEEGVQGLTPEVFPDLTWTGERLRIDASKTIISGQATHLARPWLKARMPGFPAFAETLAHGLAAQHGLGEEDQSAFAVNEQLAAAGQTLIQKERLDCRQCHAVRDLPPTGDSATNIAPGVNFALIPGRMRQEFYRRFVLDPPRYDVGVRMPKLAQDGKTTKVTDLFDGDAARQFEAIWHYLQDLQR